MKRLETRTIAKIATAFLALLGLGLAINSSVHTGDHIESNSDVHAASDDGRISGVGNRLNQDRSVHREGPKVDLDAGRDINQPIIVTESTDVVVNTMSEADRRRMADIQRSQDAVRKAQEEADRRVREEAANKARSDDIRERTESAKELRKNVEDARRKGLARAIAKRDGLLKILSMEDVASTNETLRQNESILGRATSEELPLALKTLDEMVQGMHADMIKVRSELTSQSVTWSPADYADVDAKWRDLTETLDAVRGKPSIFKEHIEGMYNSLRNCLTFEQRKFEELLAMDANRQIKQVEADAAASLKAIDEELERDVAEIRARTYE